MGEPAFNDVARFTVRSDATIRDVVENLNDSMLRVAFVVEGNRVVGSISDGDLRRAFLDGICLDDIVAAVMNRDFVAARVHMTPSVLQQLFQRGVDAIPVLDANDRLVDIAKRHVPTQMIPVAEPEITSYERDLVIEALDSGWVSSIGRFVTDFEDEFADFVGAPIALSVNNGTSAIALALWALGIGPGDDVLVPDLTFGASANAVVQAGARPVLVDVDPSTWALSPTTMASALTEKTRAILVVHLYGMPAPLDEIFTFARDHGLLVVEDCAEALGTRWNGQHVGSQSDAGTFSFFGNKTITTGEGGMVTFQSGDVAARARAIRAHGMSSVRRYWHERWGTNLRLTNLQAALGLAQLRRIESIIARKRALADRYSTLLATCEIPGLMLPSDPPNGIHSHWLYTVLLPTGVDPDVVGEHMLREGVETRRVFYPLHIQPAFADYSLDKTSYSASDEIAARGLSLPSSVKLTDEDQLAVARSLESAVESFL